MKAKLILLLFLAATCLSIPYKMKFNKPIEEPVHQVENIEA